MAAVVASLHVYPVKSCRGIAVDAAEVTPTGLATGGVADREWMIVDAQGRFVTQREAPDLARVQVDVDAGAPVLRVPGKPPLRVEASGPARDVVVWNAHPLGVDGGDAAAAALTAFLGRPHRLVRFDRSRPRPCNPDHVGASGATTLFSDGYPVLVIGEASLRELNRRLAERALPPLPMDRFRPNVVLDGLEPHEEDHVDTVEAGPLTLRLVKPCTRCAITTTNQATAERGLEPLRTLAGYRTDDRLGGVTFGMNAIVVAGAGTTLARGTPAHCALRF